MDCPICEMRVLLGFINVHLDSCTKPRKPTVKKKRLTTHETPVPGLYLFPEFITEIEERSIMKEIDSGKWTNREGRR